MDKNGKASEAAGRAFEVGLPPAALSAIQAGVMATRYRGRGLLKSPFDLVLYMQLLERLRPATLIEIGSKHGGSALWFADTMAALGLAPRIISIDLEPPNDLTDPRIDFRCGDANDLSSALSADELRALPKPWLVTEDSAHTFGACLAILRFFDDWLSPGDYIIIEDGIVADLPGALYASFEDGPNRAVARFLEERGAAYEIDASLCDFYGRNVTYNPNGWLRRVG